MKEGDMFLWEREKQPRESGGDVALRVAETLNLNSAYFPMNAKNISCSLKLPPASVSTDFYVGGKDMSFSTD